MKKLVFSVLAMIFVFELNAQNIILSEESVEERSRISEITPKSYEKLQAEAYARANNLPVRIVSKDGSVREIKRLSITGMPVYVKTTNINAAKTLSTDKVWEGGDLGLTLTGSGIVVGIWDGGIVRKTHVEFGGRVRVINDDSEESFHATHVAGTIGAKGLRAGARGMAGSCSIDSYYWGNDNQEMNTAANSGMLLSNHSYGFIQGWDYDQDANQWKWYGDLSVSDFEDYNFGFYGFDAKEWDKISYDNPYYLIVKSAGNDRGEGPNPGTQHSVWQNGAWSSSTDTRMKDGDGGFDCIGSQGTSKNILTVGAIEDLVEGYVDKESVRIASFSCFGPTDDGRIKPDIVGNGVSLLSSISGSDNAYGSSSGTSMSSPNVTGSLVLLQEHYREKFNKYMYSSMLKALVIHTADDAGTPGPDYKYGWGVMNTASAVEAISGENDGALHHDTLYSNVEKVYDFYSTGDDTIKVTMVWTDPEGEVPEISLDPKNKILVNDLDIRLIRMIDGKEFKPFVLFPNSPGRAAEEGDNSIDNIEQILVAEKMQGYYKLVINNKFSMTEPQAFSLVTSGLTKEYVASGFNELTEANGKLFLTSASQYQNSMDVQWLIKPENDEKISLYFDFFETELNVDILRLYDGATVGAPELARFSGDITNLDTIIKSTGSEMLLVFNSDAENTYSGFLAKYCTIAPVGSFEIIGEDYPCINKEYRYFALGQEGSDFIWHNTSDWQMTNQDKNGVDLLIGQGSSSIILTPFNRCGISTQQNLTINSLVDVPLLDKFEGDLYPCKGVASLFSVNNEEGTTYSWEFPLSWIGNSNSFQINLKPSSESGIVRVGAMNACGISNTIEQNIEVLDKPTADYIYTDKTPTCMGSVQEFYVISKPGHSYLWNTNDDWSIIGDAANDTVLISVGMNSNFVELLTSNKCGDRNSGRLFLTQEMPEKPIMVVSEDEGRYSQLEVTNSKDFEGIQWYRNGDAIPGEAGRSNPLIVARNGLYTVASISDKQCYNTLSEDEGKIIDSELLDFFAYRNGISTVIIENSLSVNANFNILDSRGVLLDAGVLVPGNNEIHFENKGLFILYVFNYGENAYVSKLYL